MKTIQVTIDEELLAQLDRPLKGRSRLRSAFIRESIAARLKELKRRHLERADREGYRKYPVQPDEFDVDPSCLAWGDEWEDKGGSRQSPRKTSGASSAT